jgi:hypothetical protein
MTVNSQFVVTNSGGTVDRVGYPHLLRIVNHNEDVGQDNYFEDLDWSIGHHPNCPKRATRYTRELELDFSTDLIYECEMARELERHGIERLSPPWTDLEPGEYQVVLEVSKESQNNNVYYNKMTFDGKSINDLPSRIVLL